MTYLTTLLVAALLAASAWHIYRDVRAAQRRTPPVRFRVTGNVTDGDIGLLFPGLDPGAARVATRDLIELALTTGDRKESGEIVLASGVRTGLHRYTCIQSQDGMRRPYEIDAEGPHLRPRLAGQLITIGPVEVIELSQLTVVETD